MPFDREKYEAIRRLHAEREAARASARLTKEREDAEAKLRAEAIRKASLSPERYASADQRRFVYERDGGRCVNCRRPVFDGLPRDHESKADYDHRIPHEAGGRTSVENLQLLCAPCNRAKGNWMPDVAVRLEDIDIDDVSAEHAVGPSNDRAEGNAKGNGPS